MAGVIGTSGGGYATVNPTQGNPLGEALTNVENSAFKYRALKLQEDKDAAEKDKAIKDEKAKKSADYDEKHKISKTGIKPVDVKNFEAALKLKEVYLQGEEEDKNARTIEERVAANAKKMRALNGIDTMNRFANKYNENKDNVVKNLKTFDPTSLIEVSDEGKKWDNNQFNYEVEDDGTLNFSTFDIDPNTNAVSVKETSLSEDEMLRKFMPKLATNYSGEGDGESFLDNFSKNLKAKEETLQDGKGKLITTYPTALADAETSARAASMNDDLVYKVRKQLSLPNKQIYTDDDRKEVYEKVLADAKARIPKNKIEPDYKYLEFKQSLSRDAETRRKNREGTGKDKVPVSLGTEPTKLVNKTVDGVRVTNGTYSYPLSGMMRGKEGKGMQATNIFVSPTGKMLLRIEDVGYEGDSTKKTVLTKEAQAKKAKDPKYVPTFEDYEDITTSDKNPRGRILDFGKDGGEIALYADKAGLTYKEFTEYYMNLYEQQTGTKLPRPKATTAKPRATAKPKGKKEIKGF